MTGQQTPAPQGISGPQIANLSQKVSNPLLAGAVVTVIIWLIGVFDPKIHVPGAVGAALVTIVGAFLGYHSTPEG